MKENKNVWLKVGLLMAALASTAYLLMLGWYNTLSLDDYGFVADIEEQGQWSFVKDMYFNWQGRFSAFFVSSCLMLLFGRMTNLLCYTLFQILVGVSVIGLLIKWTLPRIDRFVLWACAFLVNNIAVMAVLEPSTYFWLCCLGYFLVAYATVLLVGLLFFSKDKLWVRWTGTVLCTLYISGAAENYTPLVILVLGLYFLWLFFIKKQYRFWSDERMLMLFVNLLIMGIGFLVMLFAPGNKVRMHSENGVGSLAQQFSLLPFVTTSIKATAIMSLRLVSRSLWYVALLPVFVWLGAWLKQKGVLIPRFKVKHFLLSFFALGLFVFISVAACVFGMGWYAPPRSNSYLTFVLMACFIYWGIGIGGRVKNDRASAALACGSSVFLTVLMVVFFIKEQPEVSRYHAQVQQRNGLIAAEAAAGRTEPLVVDPLEIHWQKNSYFILRNGISKCFGKSFDKENEVWYPYMPSILSEDPGDFKNLGIQRYFGAWFEIIGSDKDVLMGVGD